MFGKAEYVEYLRDLFGFVKVGGTRVTSPFVHSLRVTRVPSPLVHFFQPEVIIRVAVTDVTLTHTRFYTVDWYR